MASCPLTRTPVGTKCTGQFGRPKCCAAFDLHALNARLRTAETAAPFRGAATSPFAPARRPLQGRMKSATTSTLGVRAHSDPANTGTSAAHAERRTTAKPVARVEPTPPPLPRSADRADLPPADATPLIAPRWEKLLATHPDRAFVAYVVNGLCNGFDIGFRGDRVSLRASNLRSSTEHSDFVDSHLLSSVAAGHTAGPFNSPPFPKMVCSGVGVVPKKSGKLRLIHHLSAPSGVSVNDGIPKELYSLHYVTIDNAIEMIMRLGKGALLAKIDIRHAFRLCPVRLADRPLLGIFWKQQYYYDLVLPFGLRSAPYIFNQVADAFQWICRELFAVRDLIHLLDDYLTAGPPSSRICAQHLQIILSACKYLGIPVADEKTELPTTSLTFLGIQLDTDLLEARLPDDKLMELRELLTTFSGLTSCSKRDLLSLLGKLNFAASVVTAGRTFMRRLWDATLSVPELYHRVSLGPTCQADLTWWRYLLDHWNGRSFFLDPRWRTATDMHLYTDAAGSIGYGAFYNGRWFTGLWSTAQTQCCITYLELYPIALACSTWGIEWSSRRVEFHSDNQAVVAALHKGSCRCPNVMSLLRALFFVCAKFNFLVSASYIKGSSNRIADSLSRQDLQTFRRLAPLSSATPDEILQLPTIPGETLPTPCKSTHNEP